MIKLNKISVLSVLIFLIFPFGGFLLSLSNLGNKKRNNFSHFMISLFFAYIFIFVPPLGDLYRYYNLHQVADLNKFHFDRTVFLYFYFLFIKWLNIPFYFTPFFAVYISVYLLLKSFDYFIFFYNLNVKRKIYILYVVIVLLNINYFVTAAGLRYVVATSIIIFSFSHYIKNKKNIILLLFFSLATIIHFSVFYFIFPFLISKCIKLSKEQFILLSIISMILSNYSMVIFSLFVDYFNYGYSYIIGKWASTEDRNLFGKLRVILNQIPFFLFLFIFILLDNSEKDKVKNLIYWLIIFVLFTKFSFVIFTRYSVVPNFLMIFYILSAKKIGKIVLQFFLIFCSVYFIIDSIYGYRRQILLGEMWRPLYISPLFFNFIKPNYDFYLTEINTKGYWIKNPVADNDK